MPPATLQPCPGGAAPTPRFALSAKHRFVQVFSCGRRQYLAYELDSGWFTPDAKMLRRIEVVARDPHIVEALLDP